MAFAEPDRIRLWERRTGAALILFVVNKPAAKHSAFEEMRAKSGFPAFLIPEKSPLAKNPSGKVIPPRVFLETLSPLPLFDPLLSINLLSQPTMGIRQAPEVPPSLQNQRQHSLPEPPGQQHP